MDIEKQPDDMLITVASMYVDGTPNNKKLYAQLVRNAKDIYSLIFHPDYKKICQNNMSESNLSLNDILNSCLIAINQKPSNEKILQTKRNFIGKRIKQL